VLDEHGRLMDGSCIGANRSSLVVDLQRFRGVLWAAKAGEVAGGWWLGAQPLIGIGRSGGGQPAALLNRTSVPLLPDLQEGHPPDAAQAA
jgi:hypothetical protein